jgi:hypothetical protein
VLANRSAQLFRDWHQLGGQEWRDAFITAKKFPAVWDRHTDLEATFPDDEAIKARFFANVELMEAVVVATFFKAQKSLPDGAVDEDVEVNPYAVSLHPDRWEEDGLFESPGLTLAAAREKLPGFENMWLDELVGAQREPRTA